MYIVGNLPSRYGAFKDLQADNYPFNKVFTKYLEAICGLGLKLGLDIDFLMGYIEDALLGSGRLPDVPAGNAPVRFRYKVENETIEQYVKDSQYSARVAVTMVVRTTLRLSQVFGTSLPRLTKLVTEIEWSAQDEDVPEAKPPVMQEPQVRTRKSAAKKDTIDRLKALTNEGNKVLQKAPPAPENVVATNPLLNDFY